MRGVITIHIQGVMAVVTKLSMNIVDHCCPAKYRTNSTGYVKIDRHCRRQRPETRGKAGFFRKSGRTKSVEMCRATH